MAESPPDGRQRNSCIAAGGLGDGVAAVQLAGRVRLFQDVERHPVLDAASEIHLLALGVQNSSAAAEAVANAQKRCVSHQTAQRGEPLFELRVEFGPRDGF